VIKKKEYDCYIALFCTYMFYYEIGTCDVFVNTVNTTHVYYYFFGGKRNYITFVNYIFFYVKVVKFVFENFCKDDLYIRIWLLKRN